MAPKLLETPQLQHLHVSSVQDPVFVVLHETPQPNAACRTLILLPPHHPNNLLLYFYYETRAQQVRFHQGGERDPNVQRDDV